MSVQISIEACRSKHYSTKCYFTWIRLYQTSRFRKNQTHEFAMITGDIQLLRHEKSNAWDQRFRLCQTGRFRRNSVVKWKVVLQNLSFFRRSNTTIYVENLSENSEVWWHLKNLMWWDGWGFQERFVWKWVPFSESQLSDEGRASLVDIRPRVNFRRRSEADLKRVPNHYIKKDK